MGGLTPPAASLMTRMKELPFGIELEAHLLYKVVKLTPSSSRLYANDQDSANCKRGGTSSRISSAKVRVRISEDEDALPGFRIRGVRGGGWNGEAVRWGGV